jgi:hypothetical protein
MKLLTWCVGMPLEVLGPLCVCSLDQLSQLPIMTLRDLVFQAKKQKRSTTATAIGYIVHTCVHAFVNNTVHATESAMEIC